MMKTADSPFRPIARRAALASLSAAALLLCTGAAPWSASVSRTDIGATVVGNPAAKVRLVEYFSYTCSHCGDFAVNAGPQLTSQYVNNGKVKVEFRNFARDPVDLTAALLARCGRETAFYGNHQAIFTAQGQWLAKVQSGGQEMYKSWSDTAPAQRTKKIAVDTGLFALMRARGYSETQLNTCLSSTASETAIVAMTNMARTTDEVRGTPAFFVNGSFVGATDWPTVKSALDAALKGA